MKLSVKLDYAARAVLSLARRYGDPKAVKIDEIAAENRIPSNYLVQIMIDLKARQIVRSVRGKEGGYRLARAPKDITLGEVLRAIHGEVLDLAVVQEADCPQVLRAAWRRIQTAVESASDAITFESLADDPGAMQRMYYI